ncbi:MAG: hypothetical protein K2X62_11750 [Beijerinckiaceae bacterium]|nr:hypothetical protein [Beijerinckiaceae bacterium]MBX9757756.1 hypothetical protein [Beijerinckiaceae bacterium]MDO9442909.1 hypothetical protein [Beijerinckiaceae bacterium]
MTSPSPSNPGPDVAAQIAVLEQDMLRLMMTINDALSQRRKAREVRALRARLATLLRDLERLKRLQG